MSIYSTFRPCTRRENLPTYWCIYPGEKISLIYEYPGDASGNRLDEAGNETPGKAGGRSSTGAIRGKNEETDKPLSSCGYRVREVCVEGNQILFLPDVIHRLARVVTAPRSLMNHINLMIKVKSSQNWLF